MLSNWVDFFSYWSEDYMIEIRVQFFLDILKIGKHPEMKFFGGIRGKQV